ncbi:MAG: hypothetical protein ABI670_05085 [Chloroflexota bacterium]
MNDKPETPSEDVGQQRPEVPRNEGTPTVDIGGSYSLPPVPQPPSYSPPAGAPQPQPQQQGYNYTPPPGQPQQYTQPPQYGQTQDFSQQGGAPTVSTGQGPMPNYQPQPGYSPPPGQPGMQGYAAVAPKDPTVGLLLELIGYVGFLGIGHIWAGKTTRGIALLVGWWVYLAISGVLTILLIGCLMLIAGIAVPIASGFYLKNEMEKEQAAMGIRRQ